MQIPRFHLPIRGREALVETLLSGALRSGLTTIWGPGGMGKTRVAVEVFDRCRRRRQRVLFISVYEDARPDGLFRQLLRAADVPSSFQLSLPPAERLGRWLGEGALIVLDEAELALDAAREVAAALGRGSTAHVLVTSREALALDGEQAMRLEPLDIEQAAQVLLAAAPRGTTDLEGARRVCERLEGLPLALTLAAGRLEVLSLEELERRLADPLPMLRNPGTEGRHSALMASIDASRRGLPDWAVAQLACLPVFASHFSLEGAEAVLPEASGGLVVDGLQLLARRSLLRVLDGADGPRFQLAPFVREAVLASGPVDEAVADRWMRWVAERAFDALLSRHRGDSDGAWLDREEADIVKALERAASDPERDPLAWSRLGAVRVSTPIATVERQAIADRLVGLDRSHADLRALSKLEEARASLAGRAGEARKAIDHLERALALARDAGDRDMEAALLGVLGNRHDNLGATDEAIALYRASLACAEAIGNPDRIARATVAVSITEDWEQTWNPQRSLERFAALIPAQRGGVSLRSLIRRSAQLHWALGRADEALACLAECTPDDPGTELWQSIESLVLRAYVQMATGRLEEAAASLDRAGERARWGGFRKQEGAVALATAQLDLRRQRFRSAVEGLGPWVGTLMKGRPDWVEIALVAEGVRAIAAARDGDDYQAGESLASAGRIAALGSTDPVYPPVVGVLPHLVAASQRLAALESGASPAADASRADRRAAMDAFEPRYAPSLQELVLQGVATEAQLDRLESAWVSYGTAGFESPSGDRVDLSRSRSSSRIFAALAALRAEEPGAVLTIEDLIDAGWPGETLVPSAARNRLHVALASLRKKGLDGVLEHVEGGYRLSPDVAFRVAEPS
jgi:predicted ATPase